MLDVRHLTVKIRMDGIYYPVLEDVSFKVDRGETLGLVGESGCGKSMTATAIMGLLARNIKITEGEIDFNGTDLGKLTPKEFQAFRGKGVSMVFQDSMAALNPLIKIGKQLAECYKLNFKDMTKEQIRENVIASLKNVGFVNPEETANKYPHQMSGGQRQRVMIAIAITAHPELLIADEPTTALDVTTQNKVLTLMKNIQKENQMSLVMISHDITVIGQTCSHVGVMYSGWMVEYGTSTQVLKDPKHPYTEALIAAIPNQTNKDKPLRDIEGVVPSLRKRPTSGCVFYERCDKRCDKCKGDIKTVQLADGRYVRCALFEDQEA